MILFIGNFLRGTGSNPTYLELVALDLKEYPIVLVSSYKNKLIRLLHMIVTILKNLFTLKLVVIDTYSTKAYNFALIISIISKLLKIPYMLNLSGGNLDYRMKYSYSFKIILKYSRINISPSKFIYKILKDNGVDSVYLPNYINLKEYPFIEKSFYAPKILWVRSFHKIYNPIMAIEVLRILDKKFPECLLCMVGPYKDNSLKDVKELSKQYSLEEKLIIKGRLTKKEIVELASCYNIFINTTNIDNLPISVLEAMALGLPVVSTNVGGIPYFLNESNSILVNKGDSIAMSNAIKKIIKENELGSSLSKVARKNIEVDHNKNSVISKWANIFDEFN
tara:strand:- start:781 stop:1788 length:1008 start_codon:yes stop_codon:yes gene_type:complete